MEINFTEKTGYNLPVTGRVVSKWRGIHTVKDKHMNHSILLECFISDLNGDTVLAIRDDAAPKGTVKKEKATKRGNTLATKSPISRESGEGRIGAALCHDGGALCI